LLAGKNYRKYAITRNAALTLALPFNADVFR
jgi:hypothetical protein